MNLLVDTNILIDIRKSKGDKYHLWHSHLTANDGIMELYDILERLQGSRITPDKVGIMEKLDCVTEVLRRYSPLFNPENDMINDEFWKVLTFKEYDYEISKG